MTLDEELKAAKEKFTTATAAALAGDNAGWHRAEIASKDVQRVLSEIEHGRRLRAEKEGAPK